MRLRALWRKMWGIGGSFQQIGQSSGNGTAPRAKPIKPNIDVNVQPSAATGARDIGAMTSPVSVQLACENAPKMYDIKIKTMIEDTMAQKPPRVPSFRLKVIPEDGIRSAWINKTRIELRQKDLLYIR